MVLIRLLLFDIGISVDFLAFLFLALMGFSSRLSFTEVFISEHWNFSSVFRPRMASIENFNIGFLSIVFRYLIHRVISAEIVGVIEGSILEIIVFWLLVVLVVIVIMRGIGEMEYVSSPEEGDVATEDPRPSDSGCIYIIFGKKARANVNLTLVAKIFNTMPISDFILDES
ncbi:hypothetical protein BpHYR1_002791 [Brachionus plicatilis]|uniref:Uncharacterized protein n=1 Tax=Brachionus plicatilis TaxID=10195 RepID=A0A3M7P1X1_BRAPC|nr:hypothetical protein BpHYR1_002791 [Brachionus plicatilis]